MSEEPFIIHSLLAHHSFTARAPGVPVLASRGVSRVGGGAEAGDVQINKRKTPNNDGLQE